MRATPPLPRPGVKPADARPFTSGSRWRELGAVHTSTIGRSSSHTSAARRNSTASPVRAHTYNFGATGTQPTVGVRTGLMLLHTPWRENWGAAQYGSAGYFD